MNNAKFTKIAKIEVSNYDGFVYDLSVEKNKNFLANGFVIHNCAKKRYIIRVHSSEGVTYQTPKYKVMGLEMVRSSTPHFVRKKLKDSLSYIFDQGETATQEYIQQCKEEFLKLDPVQVAFPRTGNGLTEYSDTTNIYRKATPIHIRGCLLYNHYIKTLGLMDRYSLINEGEKIKFIYLKLPNRLKENTIAIPADGIFPPEFGIIDKIDYDLQFEKTMIAGMKSMLDAIKWSPVPISSLDDFFS